MPPVVFRRAAAPLIFVLPFVVTGCGSSGSSGGDDTDSPDAAPGDDSGGTFDGAISPDAGVSPPSFVSNVPGATVVDVGNPPMPDLALLSLNFLQSPTGSQYFQEWFGEIENIGASVICFPQIAVVYADSSGDAILTMANTFADAAPYVDTSATETLPCIAPGAIGSFYQNGITNTSGSTNGVTTFDVTFGSFTSADDVPDPNAPTVTSMVESTNLGYEVSGTIAESTGTISNVAYRAYPRDATGLVFAQLETADLGAITPSSPYAFTSEDTSTPFTLYRGYTSYIEGPGMGARVVGPAGAPIAAVARARSAARAATDARAAIARARR